LRCRRKPPHIVNGRIATHPNQKACDAMGTTNLFVEPSGPSPSPASSPNAPESTTPGTTPPISTPSSPAPGAAIAKPPELRRRFLKPIPRADVAPGAPALVGDSEWELTDDLAERFWSGAATLVRYALGMAGHFFEVEEPIIVKYQRSLEPNSGDLHMLGQATKDGLTNFFKKFLGVKSLEAAERAINSMGGIAVLLALVFPVVAFIWQEIPRSPRWLRMKEKRAAKAKLSPSGHPVVADVTAREIPDWKFGVKKPDAAGGAAAAG
jgi:hypothetical protein